MIERSAGASSDGEGGSGGTAAALVDAAEHRFAVEGIDQASLRAVMRDAGADPGAVHYHFGGREPLAVAVLDRILAPLNARRLSLLAELEQSAGLEESAELEEPESESVASEDVGEGAPLSLSALVEALIRPDVEAAVELDGRGPGRARLIGTIYLHPADFVTAEVERHFGPVAQRFMPHLAAAVPAVPAETLSWRVRWFVFGVVGALMADDAPASTGKRGASTVDQLVADVVAAATAAVAAPAPAASPARPAPPRRRKQTKTQTEGT